MEADKTVVSINFKIDSSNFKEMIKNEILNDVFCEYNDAKTRLNVEQKIKDFLLTRFFIDWDIICDGTNNTQQVIDNRQIVCDIKMKLNGYTTYA